MRIIALVFIMSLTGCSFSGTSLVSAPAPEKTIYQKLQHIQIKRWGEVKFDGILALQATTAGLHYALIDATGIKLLQAWSDVRGDHDAIKPTGPLAGKGIAPFLSEALARLYYITLQKLPCSRTGFLSVCIANDDNGKTIKTGSFAGITYWTVEGGINLIQKKSDQAAVNTRYSQPWIGVEIILQDLSGKE